MKVLGFASILLLSIACNNAAPTATTYKQQLGAPAGATGSPAPGTGTNAGTGNQTAGGQGDPALGLTAFSSSCVGCHAFGGALALDSTKKIAEAATKSAHAGLDAAFKDSSANIAAMLSGDATNGETVIKASCESCHNGTAAGALDSFGNLTGQDAASQHGAVQTIIKDNLDDIAHAMAKRG